MSHTQPENFNQFYILRHAFLQQSFPNCNIHESSTSATEHVGYRSGLQPGVHEDISRGMQNWGGNYFVINTE
jgi:hypothetical protein